MMDNHFKVLARGRQGKILLELLEALKLKVADIRNPIPVKDEIGNQVRIGVIEVLDKFVVSPLKVAGGMVNPSDPNEFE